MKSSTNEGEDMSQGTRSVLEFFCTRRLEFLKAQSNEIVDAENILTLYNAIVDITHTFEEKLPLLEPKNHNHVATFLKEHQHNLDKFTALCCAQLHICIEECLK